MFTSVSSARAMGTSSATSGQLVLVSHLLTAGGDTPTASASCSWVIPR